jgi:predicted PurR-regulated permease PerM
MQNQSSPLGSKPGSARKWILAGFGLAVFALLLICIIHNEAISAWVGTAIGILSPIFIGILIAYLCNPLMNVLERLVFNRIHLNGLRRGISLVFTYLVVVMILVAFLAILIPQIRASYDQLVSGFDEKILELTRQIETWLENMPFLNMENTDLSEYLNKEKIFALDIQ